ncbi:MAG: MBOAT family protein [Bdellovibrionales bacterium]
MIFNSVLYFLFLPTVFWLNFSLPPRFRTSFLLLASYVFYMSWKVEYVVIVIGLTVLDFLLARWMEAKEGRDRRLLLIFSWVSNLGVLFLFKYAGFFAQESNRILHWLQVGGHIPVTDLLLPIGLSFHTFQSIGYATDVYRKRIPAEKNLIHFALFVAWFPQLVAGPIERAAALLPQLKQTRFPSQDFVRSGAYLITWGLFKKVVLADNLSPFAERIFSSPESYSSAACWIGIYSYALQIYCDFSGYTDIAKGSSLFFGVKLMDNFNRPYLARNFVDFWKRWHISLTSWFFDYVFFPMATRTRTVFGFALAALLTFMISGFWHGANWTFLIWGLMNGALYLASMVYSRAKIKHRLEIPSLLEQLLTFHLVCLCWVFFRATSLESARILIESALGMSGDGVRSIGSLKEALFGRLLNVWVGLLVAVVFTIRHQSIRENIRQSWRDFWPIILTLAFLATVFGDFNAAEFIYFQF